MVFVPSGQEEDFLLFFILFNDELQLQQQDP
jgi:hypothetical protein